MGEEKLQFVIDVSDQDLAATMISSVAFKVPAVPKEADKRQDKVFQNLAELTGTVSMAKPKKFRFDCFTLWVWRKSSEVVRKPIFEKVRLIVRNQADAQRMLNSVGLKLQADDSASSYVAIPQHSKVKMAMKLEPVLSGKSWTKEMKKIKRREVNRENGRLKRSPRSRKQIAKVKYQQRIETEGKNLPKPDGHGVLTDSGVAGPRNPGSGPVRKITK